MNNMREHGLLTFPLLFFTIMAPLSFLACNAPIHSGQTLDSSTRAFHSLTPDQRQQLEHAGLAGDAEASFRLFEYYYFTANDTSGAALWVRRAAEQGLAVAQYNLAYMLLEVGKKSPEREREAIEWLKRSAAGGNEFARKRLAELRP